MKFPTFFPAVARLSGLAVLGLSGILTAAEPASDQVLSSLMLDIDRAGNSERLIAVGERGHVLWSDDKGKAWQQTTTPQDILLTAVDFPSDNVGYAVGHDATVFKSIDRGLNWQSVYSDPKAEVPLLDVLFLNENEGFALGAYGYLIETIDGGKTWHNIAENVGNIDEYHLNAMTQLHDGTIIMVGEAGTLYRTVDKGETWEVLDSPYEGSFFGVEPLEGENSAVAYGLRGHAFVTRDSGMSWSEIDTGTTQTLFDAVVLPNNTPLMVGSAGTFSVRNGDSMLVTNQSDRSVLTSVIKTRDNAFIVTGGRGIRRVTPDTLGL